MSWLRAPVDRRIRVLIVRRRLEEHAAELVAHATGVRPSLHSNIASRLLLLATGATSHDIRAAHALAYRAGTVYAATSEVLHSRCAFGDTPEVLVCEWEAVADQVGQEIQRRLARRSDDVIKG